MISRLFLIISIISITVFSKEKVIFETFFDKDNLEAEITEGDYSFTDQGIKVTAGTRLQFTIPKARSIRDGQIHLTFIPPKMGKNLIPIISSKKECFCALKIRGGFGEVELSERWIRAQRLKDDISKVDKIISEVDVEMKEEGVMTDLKIIFRNNELTVNVNNMDMMKVPEFEYDFGDITISTYKEPFELLSFSVIAESFDTFKTNKKERYIDVPAAFHPSHFNVGHGLKQHHFIVWESGRAGDIALFTTFDSDSSIHEAIVAAGGKPGNNLTLDTWKKRKSKSSKDPDIKAKGSIIDIEILHKGNKYTVDKILKDLNNRNFDFRFAGNLAFIPSWLSGCVVCLQSCPGGKIGNSTYTIRDLVKKIPQFEVKENLPIQEGEKVILRFKIR